MSSKLQQKRRNPSQEYETVNTQKQEDSGSMHSNTIGEAEEMSSGPPTMKRQKLATENSLAIAQEPTMTNFLQGSSAVISAVWTDIGDKKRNFEDLKDASGVQADPDPEVDKKGSVVSRYGHMSLEDFIVNFAGCRLSDGSSDEEEEDQPNASN